MKLLNIELGSIWLGKKGETYRVVSIDSHGEYPVRTTLNDTFAFYTFNYTGTQQNKLADRVLVKELTREKNPEYFL